VAFNLENDKLCESYTLVGMIDELLKDNSNYVIPELVILKVIGDNFEWEIPKNLYAFKEIITEKEAREYVKKNKKTYEDLKSMVGERTALLICSKRININDSEEKQIKQYINSTKMFYRQFEEILKNELILKEQLIKKLKEIRKCPV
jgi:hypothetical protein